MDMDESHLWPVLLADWLDRIVFLWHTHRTPIIVVVLASLFLLRIYLRRANSTKDPASSSTHSSPLALGDDPKLPWSSEKLQQVLSRPPADEEVHRPRPVGPKLVTGRRPLKGRKASDEQEGPANIRVQTIVFYCSLTGTTAQLVQDVASILNNTSTREGRILTSLIHDLSYIDLDDFFISGPRANNTPSEVKYFYCLLIPSYNIDTIMTNFLSHLDETHNDFRIDTATLSSLLGYSVFGVGDKEGWPTEAEGFCSQAIEVDKWLAKLTGRKRAYPLGLGDVKGNLKAALDEWTTGVQKTVLDLSINGDSRRRCVGEWCGPRKRR